MITWMVASLIAAFLLLLQAAVLRQWFRRQLARDRVAIRAQIAANYADLRSLLHPTAGYLDYAAAHDAEQAARPVLTPPPGADDPIYGVAGGAGAPAAGAADEPGDSGTGRHHRRPHPENGTRFGRTAI